MQVWNLEEVVNGKISGCVSKRGSRVINEAK
jgi:hypothetical protein